MTADILGVNLLFKALNSKAIRILMYHGITTDKLPSFYWTQMDKDKFTWQMNYLDRHYDVIKLSSIIDNDNEHAVSITFDDGLENVYREAWPVLKIFGLKAACFVLPELSAGNKCIWPDRIYSLFMHSHGKELDISQFGLDPIVLADDIGRRYKQYLDLIGKMKNMDNEKRQRLFEYILLHFEEDNLETFQQFRLMTPSEIMELSDSDEFEIGAHTGNHPILSRMTKDEQTREIEKSIRDIEQWGIKFYPIFAYPNGNKGDYNDDTIMILKELGFKAALTTIDGLHRKSDDLFNIRRIPIGADMSNWEFKARLSGFYYILKGSG